MTEIQELLDRARQMCSPPSWYRLAKNLKISHARLSNWTRGRNTPDPDACIKLADFLHADRTDVLALVLAQRHKGAAQGDFWNRLTPRVLPAAIIAFTLAGFAGSGRLNADQVSSSPGDPVYIMRTRRITRRREGFARVRRPRATRRGPGRYAAPGPRCTQIPTSRRLA